jgi:quinol monooxygenase YgiN
MFAVTVTFLLHPGRDDAFLPEMQENAAQSLRDEPGCLQFDIATDPSRPGEVFLYELYADAAAFAAHLASAHFACFTEATSGMVAEKHVRTYEKVIR